MTPPANHVKIMVHIQALPDRNLGIVTKWTRLTKMAQMYDFLNPEFRYILVKQYWILKRHKFIPPDAKQFMTHMKSSQN